MADKMTLEQLRDWHRSRMTEDASPTFYDAHRRMADVLDAHIAAMGEPVAEVIAQDLTHHGSPRAIKHLYPIRDKSDLLRPGTKLYTSPPQPIDVAACTNFPAERVPEAIADNDPRKFLGWSNPDMAYRAGWNQCRAAMLDIAQESQSNG